MALTFFSELIDFRRKIRTSASIPASENHFGGEFSRPEGGRERLWGAAPGPAATGGAPREPGSDFDRAGCSGLTPPRGAPGVHIVRPSPWPPPPVRLLLLYTFTYYL